MAFPQTYAAPTTNTLGRISSATKPLTIPTAWAVPQTVQVPNRSNFVYRQSDIGLPAAPPPPANDPTRTWIPQTGQWTPVTSVPSPPRMLATAPATGGFAGAPPGTGVSLGPNAIPGAAATSGAQVPFAGDPWGGFAGRYTPGSAELLMSNPSQIFYDTMGAMGLMPGGDMGAVKMLEPYADVVPMLWAIYNANLPDAQFLSPEQQINYFSNFAQQMMTPGGQGINPGDLLQRALQNPEIMNMFQSDNPAQNVNAFNDFRQTIAALSFNPWIQRMTQAANDRGSYGYLSGYTQGQNPGNYAPWLQAQGLM